MLSNSLDVDIGLFHFADLLHAEKCFITQSRKKQKPRKHNMTYLNHPFLLTTSWYLLLGRKAKLLGIKQEMFICMDKLVVDQETHTKVTPTQPQYVLASNHYAELG